MTRWKKSWPSDAFDAIHITSAGGNFEIEGTDGDQVEFEAQFESRWSPPEPAPSGRWLALQLWNRHAEGDFTLRVPKNKAWVVDLSAARGAVQARGVRARLRVMLGKGSIEAKDCRGVIALAAGKGEIKIERYTQEQMPDRPPLGDLGQSRDFKMPPMPEGPIAFGIGFKNGPGRARMRGPWGWADVDAEAWSEWGTQMGEQASAWAEAFTSRMLAGIDWPADNGGIGIATGKGETELKEIESKAVVIRTGSGEVKFQSGQVQDLELSVSHGEIEVKDVLPTGAWSLETRHGDIHLALPAETQGRIDAATRHGEIESDVPLVRVARPGPGARHGGRMVGTLGAADGQGAEINLVATSGDIEIEWDQHARPREQRRMRVEMNVEEETRAAPGAEVKEEQRGRYDSQLSILEALSHGEISVDEAEQLLKASR